MNAITVIMAGGDLKMADVIRIRSDIRELCEERQRRIVLDLGAADWIEPLAIGVLMECRHTTLHQAGELKLARIHPLISRIFQRYGVAEYFESYGSIEEAISSFDDDWQGAMEVTQ